jgi:GAF domain-containing protein
MKPAPLPPNEAARLKALRRYQLINSLPEEVYDDITKIASEICGTPIAIINLIDENRQWTKARYGIELKELPREQSMCAHAILAPDEIMIVPDARYDERFFDSPLVVNDLPVIFYAGMPISDSSGYPLGTLCVVDSRPRDLSDQKLMALRALAKLVQTHFDLRITKMELEENNKRLSQAQPLVNTMLTEIENMEKSHTPSLPGTQAAPFKETVIALKNILEGPDSFREQHQT